MSSNFILLSLPFTNNAEEFCSFVDRSQHLVCQNMRAEVGRAEYKVVQCQTSRPQRTIELTTIETVPVST